MIANAAGHSGFFPAFDLFFLYNLYFYLPCGLSFKEGFVENWVHPQVALLCGPTS